MIQKFFENEEQSLRLFPVEQKNIELSFSGERISSDGGLLLLREVNRQIGLIEQISNCITDNRDQRYIDHTIEELVSQRAYQIAAGYEDCNDSDELRHDQILKTCVGRLPQTGKDLGSQPTMSRLENSFSWRDLYNIGKAFVSHFMESYSSAPDHGPCRKFKIKVQRPSNPRKCRAGI